MTGPRPKLRLAPKAQAPRGRQVWRRCDGPLRESFSKVGARERDGRRWWGVEGQRAAPNARTLEPLDICRVCSQSDWAGRWQVEPLVREKQAQDAGEADTDQADTDQTDTDQAESGNADAGAADDDSPELPEAASDQSLFASDD